MTSGISNHIVKFISSQKMESSEIRQQVIRLGKKLVKELGDERADTLSQWMSHYIAEKISESNSAQGKDKQDLNSSCYEAILNLWDHRSNYPEEKRPFKRFEAIYRTIEKLDPDNKTPLYSYFNDYHDKDSKRLRANEKNVQKWLNIALNFDDLAKVWIEFSLSQAFEAATDEGTKKWIKEAKNLPADEDLSVIVKFIHSAEDEQSDIRKIRQQEIDRLNDRIEKLEAFNYSSARMLEAYSAELTCLLEGKSG